MEGMGIERPSRENQKMDPEVIEAVSWWSRLINIYSKALSCNSADF